MTLIITLYILLLSSLGAHTQRTMSDIEHELQHDVTKAELQLKRYYANYKKENDELQKQITNCNRIRIKFYSCDYDRMFDMTYILHEIQYQYILLSRRSNKGSEQADIYKRKIRRLYFQLEALRRLNPEHPLIDEIPDSIRHASSDSLLNKIYSDSGYSEQMLPHRRKMDNTMCRQRDNAIRYGRRLLVIYSIFLENDSLMRHRYDMLRQDFMSTYNDAKANYELLQHDIVFKHEMPFYKIVSDTRELFNSLAQEEKIRYDEWNKQDTRHAFRVWVLILMAISGFLLAFLIANGIIYLTRNKPDKFVSLKRKKWLWIWAITDVFWFLFFEIALTFVPSELVLAGGIVIVIFLGFLLSVRLCNIIVGRDGYPSETIRMYGPITAMAFVLLVFRLFFIADQMIAIELFPITTILLIWQMSCMRRFWAKVNRMDAVVGLISSVIFLFMSVASFLGFIYMALAVFYWWQCQVMMLCIIGILIVQIKYYSKNVMTKRVKRYYDSLGIEYDIREDHPVQITWLHDLLRMVIVPLMIVNSLPICIYLALAFFNASDSFLEVFYRNFFSIKSAEGTPYMVLSGVNICFAVSLFFCFRFARYILVNIYRQIKKDIVRRKEDTGEAGSATINYTLGTNTIALFVWASFVVALCIRLQIPMRSLTFILTGLATGIGFALKDVLNNLFYGMQLMAGRLKVGDYVICEKYRGTVKSISYQTTQMLTEEGALVCFGNAELFNKNFQNLTSHNPYEVTNVTFYVPYGADLQLVERIAREATESLNTRDSFGRPLLSTEEGIRIEFGGMGSSSLEMSVRFGVIAQKSTWFLPILRKAVYTELTNHGITAPYNKLDLHIVKGDMPALDTENQ